MNTYLFNNKKITVIVDENNEPWFRGKDITEILEYSDPDQAIRKYVNIIDKQKLYDIKIFITQPMPYKKNTMYINTIGIRKLVLHSTNQQANMFKRWIFKTVLPSINKKYKLCQQIDSLINQLESQLLYTKQQLFIN